MEKIKNVVITALVALTLVNMCVIVNQSKRYQRLQRSVNRVLTEVDKYDDIERYTGTDELQDLQDLTYNAKVEWK